MNFKLEQVPSYYRGYIELVDDEGILELLHSSRDEFTYLINTFTEEKGNFSYESGKWTVKDIIQHVTDSERVFSYRALRFARADATKLEGFDQNEYAAMVPTSSRLLKDLIAEFVAVRASTIQQFEGFDEEMLERNGNASGVEFRVDMLGFLISGHLLHHLKIINERYL